MYVCMYVCTPVHAERKRASCRTFETEARKRVVTGGGEWRVTVGENRAAASQRVKGWGGYTIPL